MEHTPQYMLFAAKDPSHDAVLDEMAQTLVNLDVKMVAVEQKLEKLKAHNREHESACVIVIGLVCGLMLILGCIFLIVDMYIPGKKDIIPVDKDDKGVETITIDPEDKSWALLGGNWLVFLSSLGFIITFLIHAIKRLYAANGLTFAEAAASAFYDKSPASKQLSRQVSDRSSRDFGHRGSGVFDNVVFHEAPSKKVPVPQHGDTFVVPVRQGDEISVAQVIPLGESLRQESPSTPSLNITSSSPSPVPIKSNPLSSVEPVAQTQVHPTSETPLVQEQRVSGLYNRFNYAGSRAGYAPLNRNYY